MRAMCHESWEGVEELSSLITVSTIEDARVFIMDDQPQEFYKAVEAFVAEAIR